MRLWKKLVRNYFTFNNREKRGLYVLILLLVLLSTIHLVIRLQPAEQLAISEEQESLLAAFDQAQSSVSSDTDVVDSAINQGSLDKIEWKSFDPNIVTVEELMSLGLDSTIAHRLVKYRSKGGKFKDANDLRKIYGMDSSWIETANTHMSFPEGIIVKHTQPTWAINQPKDTIKSKMRKAVPKVELNAVDSATLVQLPWIGPFYAKEIVKLRSGLGGFRSYEQLLAVYKIRDEAIESIIDHSTLDTSLIQRININEVDLKRLGYHPYLTWKQARIIINYRDQHGDYRTVKDIQKTLVISDSVYLKIAPYLSTE
jgi:competence protein ComEA